jgi:hypothetical protein
MIRSLSRWSVPQVSTSSRGWPAASWSSQKSVVMLELVGCLTFSLSWILRCSPTRTWQGGALQRNVGSRSELARAAITAPKRSCADRASLAERGGGTRVGRNKVFGGLALMGCRWGISFSTITSSPRR